MTLFVFHVHRAKFVHLLVPDMVPTTPENNAIILVMMVTKGRPRRFAQPDNVHTNTDANDAV